MNTRMLKPTILSVSLLTMMASAAVAPALGEIGKYFPHVDKTVIKLILTLPSLIVIPFSLLSGVLVTKTGKKNVLLTGLIIYLFAGIAGGFARTITQLLIIRGILGIGIGLIMPISLTLITDFFEGQARNKMMGLQGAANQLGGMLLLPLAGWLAFLSWRYAFFVYGLALISFLFVLLWLPETPRSFVQKQKSTKIKIPVSIFYIAGLALMMMNVFYVVATDLALFIDKEKAVFSSTKAPVLFSSETPLFKNREEFVFHLNQGTISKVTKDIFKANGYILLDKASLKEIKPGKEWEIINGIKTYIIKKEAGRLVIYAGLGTSGIASNTLAVMSFFGIIAGLILSFVMKLFKNYTVPFAAILMGLGFATLGNATGIWMLFVAMCFIGLGCGLMSPPLMLLVPKLVSPNSRSLAMAIITSSLLFGQFISPIFMKSIAFITDNDTFRFRFNFLAVFLITAAIFGIIGIMMIGKSKENIKTD